MTKTFRAVLFLLNTQKDKLEGMQKELNKCNIQILQPIKVNVLVLLQLQWVGSGLGNSFTAASMRLQLIKNLCVIVSPKQAKT